MELSPLTKAQQRLLAMLPRGVFSFSDAKRLAGASFRGSYLPRILRELIGAGRVFRVKKGVFYSGALSDALFDYNLGLFLCNSSGYVAFSTALYFHGLLDEKPGTYFIATEWQYLKKSFNSISFVLVPMHENFYGITVKNGVRVSTLAKTFFDCLLKPRLAGGFKKIFTAFSQTRFSRDEWRELLYYLLKTENKSLRQKTGFLFEREASPPKFFLKKLFSSIAEKNIVLISYGPALGKKKLDKKWGVYYNG